ncbi:hypothetical protein B0T26DRAFT_531102 [Lasiosphaeria miniovina]|uniref:Uncharacterized protein n=1 Tax=Lasiosphaeria miniovina TaxID=1954250 RepID=A0AA39ZQF9_9PEZI|nr:uncharacterized protein B0T26DRAFT_531102 [Lasiosphaeria miniovina]KAK0701800.1 hypothetical protein B0T26DRAFT_531102 [Lasiosphaeria miniovina]
MTQVVEREKNPRRALKGRVEEEGRDRDKRQETEDPGQPLIWCLTALVHNRAQRTTEGAPSSNEAVETEMTFGRQTVRGRSKARGLGLSLFLSLPHYVNVCTSQLWVVEAVVGLEPLLLLSMSVLDFFWFSCSCFPSSFFCHRCTLSYTHRQVRAGTPKCSGRSSI